MIKKSDIQYEIESNGSVTMISGIVPIGAINFDTSKTTENPNFLIELSERQIFLHYKQKVYGDFLDKLKELDDIACSVRSHNAAEKAYEIHSKLNEIIREFE